MGMLVGEMLTYFSDSFFSFIVLGGISSCLLLQKTHILKLATDLSVYSIVFFLVPFPFPVLFGTIDKENMCGSELLVCTMWPRNCLSPKMWYCEKVTSHGASVGMLTQSWLVG